MTTAPFLDKNGATVNMELPLTPGTAADAVSRPVAFSTEGKAQLGAIAETAPTTDIASSGLNGRLQRVAQRITSLIALLPAALGTGGGLKVDGSGTALPVSGTLTANAGTGNFATVPGSSETKVTAATIGAGGVGYLGWLSTIANYLAGTLTVTANAGTNLNTSTLATSVQIGEVQASPTANTVLDRLKAIATAITSATVGTTAPGTEATQGIFAQGAASMVPFKNVGYMGSPSTDITRPADVLQYAINDAWADSTSAPTTGGFTLAAMARLSGGSGVITDIMITSSAVPGTLLQGELHIFNAAVTAMNDNAAWNLSDADAKKRVAVHSFTLLADANNSYVHLQNLSDGFTCVGSADLRYLVKVKNAYTPISGEVLTVLAKSIPVT